MKVISAESNLASATNVGNATVVRVYNSDSSVGTITKKDAAGNTLGTMTVSAGEVVYCEKQYTDTLEGGSTLKASQIAYSDMMYYASYTASGGGAWSGVSSGLIGRYDFNDTSTYSGSGSAVNDLSGNGNNGTKNTAHSNPTYSSTFASSDVGNTMLFGQQQTEISFGGNFPHSSVVDISMFTWFYPTAFNNYNVIFSKQSSSGWDFAMMMKDVGGSTYRLTVETGADYDTHSADLYVNKWYYLGFTLDGPNGDLKLYVRGFSNPSATTHSNEGRGTNDTSKPFYVGEERSFDAGAAGHMSQLQIYNKVLSASEVQQNYDADKTRFGY